MKIPEHIQKVYQQAICLYSKEQVERALDKLALQISDTLQNANPLILSVMVGGLIPTAGILERIDFPLELDYIHITRYSGKTSKGELVWKNKPSTSLLNRTVLVVDDILDGGVTLQTIIEYCQQQGAQKVYSTVLVEKEHVREASGLAHADFTGLYVGNHYVFGYGMDYQEYLRNAPGIYAVSKEYL